MGPRRWLLPAVSLAAVLAVTAWEFASARTGPGPLHPAHGELEGFFGSDCSSCHEAGSGVRAQGCIACHEPIGSQRDDAVGLHGSLPRHQLEDCSQCHSEHHGAATPLITPSAFALAGVADKDSYDHRHVAEFRLTGAHAALACDQCHPAASSSVPPQGGRFLGASQACTACHEDVHQTLFGSDCEKCHGQEQAFRAAPGFDHSIFPLHDSHSRVGCEQCHAEGTDRSTSALSKRPQPARGCADCHEDPHHGGSATVAAAILLKDTRDCARCHESTAFADARVTPEKHAEFGFPLRGGHARTECVKCHGDGKSPSLHGSELPPLLACARCHEAPHAVAFVAAAVVQQGPGDGCAGCHDDAHEAFREGTTTRAQHAATGFLLDLPHVDVDCAKCHSGETFRERYPGRQAADCRACHEDVHRGQFDHEDRYAQCTACHQPTAFHPNAFGAAMHGKTRFALTGAHDAVACARCHKDVSDSVRAFHGTPTACSSCHEDVHEGAFDKQGKPAAIAGREGCARCHDTAAFTPVHGSRFDHGLWTGHALAGAHQQLDCLQCHTQAEGSAHRRLGKAAGKRCADCHDDVHQGQFGRAAAVDCARCHGEEDFHKLRFDHDRDSRFRLDAQHAPLECSKCHLGYESAAGRVVRYKPLGVECGDCHRLGSVEEGRQ